MIWVTLNVGWGAANCRGNVMELSGNFTLSGEWSPCRSFPICPIWGDILISNFKKNTSNINMGSCLSWHQTTAVVDRVVLSEPVVDSLQLLHWQHLRYKVSVESEANKLVFVEVILLLYSTYGLNSPLSSTGPCPAMPRVTWPMTVSVSSSPTPVSDNCVLPTLKHSLSVGCTTVSETGPLPPQDHKSAAQCQTIWLSYGQFRQLMKTFLFGQWGHGAVWTVFNCTE